MTTLDDSNWLALPNTPPRNPTAIVWPSFSLITLPNMPFSVNIILHPTHIPGFQSSQLPIPLIQIVDKPSIRRPPAEAPAAMPPAAEARACDESAEAAAADGDAGA